MTPKTTTVKPVWPYSNIVPGMFPAGNGQWAKKIGGRRYHFGPWADAKGALDRYNDESASIRKGESVGVRVGARGASVETCVQYFLAAKIAKVKAGRLSARMYDDYRRVCVRILNTLGKNKLVAKLLPVDFNRLATTFGPSKTRWANEVIWTRIVFKWAYESDLLETPVKFGPEFVRPNIADLRRQKNKRGRGRLYKPDQIKKLIESAPTMLKAAMLLGINAGFGNTDCSVLTDKDLDLDTALIDTERHKTGYQRTVTLWPETVQALQEWIQVRPKVPKSLAGLVFITPGLQPLVRISTDTDPENPDGMKVVKVDYIAQVFKEHAKAQGLKGKTFYDLRHTFRTIAESGAFKERTICRIMGHLQAGMGTEYIHDFSPEKLRAVTDYVRNWYLKSPSEAATAAVEGSVPPESPPVS